VVSPPQIQTVAVVTVPQSAPAPADTEPAEESGGYLSTILYYGFMAFCGLCVCGGLGAGVKKVAEKGPLLDLLRTPTSDYGPPATDTEIFPIAEEKAIAIEIVEEEQEEQKPAKEYADDLEA
jgi:hypothetical protein